MISFTSTCIVNAGDCGNLGLSDIPMDRSARGTHILWLVGSHVHGFKKKSRVNVSNIYSAVPRQTYDITELLLTIYD